MLAGWTWCHLSTVRRHRFIYLDYIERVVGQTATVSKALIQFTVQNI